MHANPEGVHLQRDRIYAPHALLYANNQDGKLNRGSFRFTQVHALPVGGQTWTRFPHGKTWFYTDHPKYMWVKLSHTSFIAKSL
jgi:hypothetical protein